MTRDLQLMRGIETERPDLIRQEAADLVFLGPFCGNASRDEHVHPMERIAPAGD